MISAGDDDTRDRDAIERELRLLVSVRSAYRERGGALPSMSQMDELLDELLELDGAPSHQQDNGTRDSTSNPCR
ncbi:MAG: hypothetical protein WB777_13295 [Mycobacterium sp.]